LLRIDPKLAESLDLPVEVSEPDLAKRLAVLADAKPPQTPGVQQLWIALATEIERRLVSVPRRVMDTAEAAEYVVSAVEGRTQFEDWVEVFAPTSGPRDIHDPSQNPDSRLRRLIAQEIAPRLADLGLFRLVEYRPS
jgi:hypothetical protein